VLKHAAICIDVCASRFNFLGGAGNYPGREISLDVNGNYPQLQAA